MITPPGPAGRPATGGGQGLSFEEVFRADHRAIVAVTLALVGSRPVAEELVQEAFLRAHQRWEVIGRYDNPGAWVRRVAINLAVSDQRRRASERRAVTRLRPDAVGEADRSTEVVAADRFWTVVRQLPAQQRSVVVLRYVEDRSVHDIAEVLDLAEGTVKAHLHKARVALGRRLAIDPEDDR
jgi:RNA polymerase sigma-70 factor (ECF subfamily)